MGQGLFRNRHTRPDGWENPLPPLFMHAPRFIFLPPPVMCFIHDLFFVVYEKKIVRKMVLYRRVAGAIFLFKSCKINKK